MRGEICCFSAPTQSHLPTLLHTLTSLRHEDTFQTEPDTPLNKPSPQEASETPATPAANQEPPGAKQDPSEDEQETPQAKQDVPSSEHGEKSPPLADDSTKEEDPPRPQEPAVPNLALAAEDTPAEAPKVDTAAMEAAVEASAESLKSTIQPQVDALWDAVKWVEDRMEIVDTDRRGELEDAARAAAQNTAKVNPRNGVLFTLSVPSAHAVLNRTHFWEKQCAAAVRRQVQWMGLHSKWVSFFARVCSLCRSVQRFTATPTYVDARA